MSEKQQNLQDTFLNAVRKSEDPVTMFLVNGVMLQGAIAGFDERDIARRGQTDAPDFGREALGAMREGHRGFR